MGRISQKQNNKGLVKTLRTKKVGSSIPIFLSQVSSSEITVGDVHQIMEHSRPLSVITRAHTYSIIDSKICNLDPFSHKI